MTTVYSSLENAISVISRRMETSGEVIQPASWQSMDVSKMPGSVMIELTNVMFTAPLGTESLDYYRAQIKPNLPWADEHFVAERVSGNPWNPGTTWRNWPWASSADKFRKEGEKFSHTYAERFWPKYANRNPLGELTTEAKSHGLHKGIRYNYGDLTDVIKLLAKDPHTRQAYLPIWFPEDTGVVHGERVPCTLGYHFLMRNNTLDLFYTIRSCDFYRHFRDDLYLAIRLLIFVLEKARAYNQTAWEYVEVGKLTFWAGSLHMFIADYQKLFKHNPIRIAPSRVTRG